MPDIQFANAGSYVDRRLLPNGVIHWCEAKDHLNEVVTVYGEVATTFFNWDEYERNITAYLYEGSAPPTFIEIGAAYPNTELVKIVIWGQNRGRFPSSPDSLYKGHAVVFTGRPYMYNDLVTMQISSPNSIQIVSPIENLYLQGKPDQSSDNYIIPVFSNCEEDTDREDDDDYYEDDVDYGYQPRGRQYDPWDDPIAIAFNEYYENDPMAEYEDDPWSYVYSDPMGRRISNWPAL